LVNFIILIVWSAIDPYSPLFILDSDPLLQVNLTGRWACKSNNLVTWMVAESMFYLVLLIWGVFVIYQTWALSSKRGLNLETKWVLIAFYNFILNLAFLGPIFAIGKLSDASLALVMAVSIDFSGGGVILAVLLPRLLKIFKPFSKYKKKDTRASTMSSQRSLSPTLSPSKKKSINIPEEDREKISTEMARASEQPRQGLKMGAQNDMSIYPIDEERKASQEYRKSTSQHETPLHDTSQHETPLHDTSQHKTPLQENPDGSSLQVTQESEKSPLVEIENDGLAPKQEPQKLLLTNSTTSEESLVPSS